MKIEKIVTSNGIADVKITAENNTEVTFLKQLVDAGTLVSLSGYVGSSAVFRPMSIMEEDFRSSEVTTTNSIGTYNFDMRQNEEHKVDLKFKTDGAAIDLSGFDSITLQIKREKLSSPLVSLSIGDGLTVMGLLHDKLGVTIKAGQTKLLTETQYYYDVLFTKGTINTYYLEGTITVITSVTR